MTLNEYIDRLNAIKEEFSGELELIFSKDDEGNGFCRGVGAPYVSSLYPNDSGYYIDSLYYPEDEDEEVENDEDFEKVVCIN